MYHDGQGLPQNHKETFKWSQKEADQGNTEVRHIFELTYFECRGVPQNSKEAVRWLMKSADQRYAETQCDLGVIYYTKPAEAYHR